jgi:uncharacterized membrane protein
MRVRVHERNERAERLALGLGCIGLALGAIGVAAHISRKRRLSPHANSRATSARSRLHIARTVTINKPLDEVYRFWRDFTNLPRVMRSVESVRETDNRRSHWCVRVPGGVALEWDAEITEDREAEAIAWRTLNGTISHRGSVTFTPAPGARGTELRIDLSYEAPGGAVGATMASLLDGAFEHQLQEDLRRCKQYLETGEIPVSEGAGRAYAGVHS